MIEAELKARVHAPDTVRARLAGLADEEAATYADTYYDWPDRRLTNGGWELRVRVVETDAGRRTLLTYKEPPADTGSGSKPEHETAVDDDRPVDVMLRGLGLTVLVELTKHCRNYRFRVHGRDMLATLVTVPELHGTFLEVETIAEPNELDAALGAVRAVLDDLDLLDDLDATDYTDAVMRARGLLDKGTVHTEGTT
ncbi:MAG TPA: class IV adenylate cyclase [Streptosporangiales bacterium]